MKHLNFFSVLIICITMIISSVSAQQDQPLATNNVDKNRKIQVSDFNQKCENVLSVHTEPFEDIEHNSKSNEPDQSIIPSQSIQTYYKNMTPLNSMNPGPNLTVVKANCTYNFNYPNLTIEVRIINDGTSSAGGSRLGYYLSTDKTISTADDRIGDEYVSGLAVGSYSHETITVNVSAYPGTWWVGFIIDYQYNVAEDNENDNVWYFPTSLVIPHPPPLPDLIVTSVEVIDSEGPDISCKLTIINDGTNETNSQFKNIIYLSQDQIITSTDYRINDWNVTQSLSPGESKSSWDLNSTVSGVPAGEYYMGAIADGNNDIVELNENNNTKYTDSPKVIIPEEIQGPEIPEQPEEPKGNMIMNWSFVDSMDDWQFFIWGSSNALGLVKDGVFYAVITSGGVNPSEVTLHQYDLTIINGNTYTVSFYACATGPRDIEACIAMANEPYTRYNSDNIFSLTKEWQTFAFTFTMNDPSDPEAHIRFDCGDSDVDVYLDNISLMEIASSTDVQKKETSQSIKTFELFQNYPNPFNPLTTIRYRIPESCFVSLKVYDLLGGEMTTLFNDKKASGEYTVEWDGKDLPSGIYVYQLRAGDFTETRKLVLQK